MDTDVTEPIPAAVAPSPARNVRPAIMVGGAALAVLLAAIAALVWTFSDDSKDAAKPKAIATAPSKAPTVAPSSPAKPEDSKSPTDLAGGMPGGLDPAALFGGDSGLTSNPAFSTAGAPTYGSGAGAPTTGLVKPPNVEWPKLGWQDVAPAMAAGLDAGEVSNLLVDIGDWVYGAGVVTANNATDLVATGASLYGDLLLYDALIRTGTGGSTSLESLVTSAASAGISSTTVVNEAVGAVSDAALVNPLADTSSTLNALSAAVTNVPSVQMPDAAALGSLPKMAELPSLGSLPQLPAAEWPSLGAMPELPSLDAMPKIELPGLPKAPEIGLPSLPTPEQIGMGAALTAAVPAFDMPKMPSLEDLQKLPAPKLPNMGLPKIGLPKIGLPKIGLPRFGPPRLGLSVPSITKLMGLPF